LIPGPAGNIVTARDGARGVHEERVHENRGGNAMKGRFWISVVAMFVLTMLMGIAVHGFLLQNDYARLPQLMRTPQDSQSMFPYMVLAHVFLAFGITWIYLMGRQDKPWFAQGIRFGIALAVFSIIPTYLIYFAVMPFPSDLVAQQIVFDSIGVVLLGVAIAWINR
jgi:hypothetical protein